jgi:hypothetical protein
MDERRVSRREIVRRGLRSGIGVTAALSLALAGASTADAAGRTRKPAPIPPNCIYVCCDGTCDSWKMCLKCVEWPKKVASQSASMAISAERTE